MQYVLTFLEGVLAFVSPCMLPMLPIYLAYFGGGSDAEGQEDRTLIRTLGFVLGFSVVFVSLGAFSGIVGSALVRWQRFVDVACGAIVIALGLNYLGVIRIPVLNRTVRFQTKDVPGSFLSSMLFGVTFAVGWSPCVGTFLASALSLAASSGSVLQGITLLTCYSLGMGLPFVLSGMLVGQLKGTLGLVKSRYDLVNRISGIFLVIMGVLMATGTLGTWLRMLS